jgi:hypothetical protein
MVSPKGRARSSGACPVATSQEPVSASAFGSRIGRFVFFGKQRVQRQARPPQKLVCSVRRSRQSMLQDAGPRDLVGAESISPPAAACSSTKGARAARQSRAIRRSEAMPQCPLADPTSKSYLQGRNSLAILFLYDRLHPTYKFRRRCRSL